MQENLRVCTLRFENATVFLSSEELTKAVAAVIFLAGKCPNFGRDSISCCWKIGEEFSSSDEVCRETLPARNFKQPQPSRVFRIVLLLCSTWPSNLCFLFSEKSGKPPKSNDLSLRAQRLKKFKILNFSSEIENFKRATHQTPIYCGKFWKSGIENFNRDWKFQARLKISSKIDFFNLWALRAFSVPEPQSPWKERKSAEREQGNLQARKSRKSWI